MRETCHEVLDELGLHDDRLFKLALKLEKIALEDEYFIDKKALPQCRFLFRHRPARPGYSRLDVHRHIHHGPHRWMDRAME